MEIFYETFTRKEVQRILEGDYGVCLEYIGIVLYPQKCVGHMTDGVLFVYIFLYGIGNCKDIPILMCGDFLIFRINQLFIFKWIDYKKVSTRNIGTRINQLVTSLIDCPQE